MGAVCCCWSDEWEDFANPNSSVYRNCVCLRCFVQNFLLVYASVFQRGGHALPSSSQGTTSFSSTEALDDSLADMYHAPPRPLPYDANPRYVRIQPDESVLRREKGSTQANNELEPLRMSAFEKESDSLSYTSKQKDLACDEGSKEYHLKSALKLSTVKTTTGFAHIYPSSEDEDVCPTCLEEYTDENPKILTKCSHHFHLGCIYEWMERSNTCPVCCKVVRQVSCGAAHVVALSEDGLLQAWGFQGAHVIDGYAMFLNEAPLAFVHHPGFLWRISHCSHVGKRRAVLGELGAWVTAVPRRVVALDRVFVKDVSCGGVHTCALTETEALYVWGGGVAGQLGLGRAGFFPCSLNESETMLHNIPVTVIPTNVQLVTCVHSHTLICTKDGKIHGWGYNSYCQAANENSTYAWCPSPVDWCVGEVRKLAAGGGHSALLTDACSLKELCEFRLADSVTLSNSSAIEDAASRTGSDAFVRLCGRFRDRFLNGGDGANDDEDDKFSLSM